MTTNNHAAFEAVYLAFAPSLQRYFAACFGPSVAEDLTQQLFLKVWTYHLSHPDFEPTDWRAWLFRAAVNLKNDHIRWIKSLPQPFSLEEEQDAPADPFLLPDSADQQIDQISVRAALYRMKEKERDLILLKYMGFTSGEMGKILGISASAARSRCATARDHFAEELKKGAITA